MTVYDVDHDSDADDDDYNNGDMILDTHQRHVLLAIRALSCLSVWAPGTVSV